MLNKKQTLSITIPAPALGPAFTGSGGGGSCVGPDLKKGRVKKIFQISDIVRKAAKIPHTPFQFGPCL